MLKGFTKVLVEPKKSVQVMFNLSSRDVSYWDDSKGKSKWVCASGKFTACVGANARDAVLDPKGPNCVEFEPSCDEDSANNRRALLSKKFEQPGGKLSPAPPPAWVSTTAAAAVLLVSVTSMAIASARRLNIGRGEGHSTVDSRIGDVQQVPTPRFAGEHSDQEPLATGIDMQHGV